MHYDADQPEQFEADFADRVNELAADPERAKAMAQAGRDRAVDEFSWLSIAQQTVDLYRTLL